MNCTWKMMPACIFSSYIIKKGELNGGGATLKRQSESKKTQNSRSARRRTAAVCVVDEGTSDDYSGSTLGEFAPQFCKTIEEVIKLKLAKTKMWNALLTHRESSRRVVCGSCHMLHIHRWGWRDDADPSYPVDSKWDQSRHEVHAHTQSLSITSSEQSAYI